MVDLIVSTVKLDADEYDAGLADLPFCFRIISPTSRLTLQAESDEERAAWVAALQGKYAALCSLVALTTWAVIRRVYLGRHRSRMHPTRTTPSPAATACSWRTR
jgi:hypothetical protein